MNYKNRSLEDYFILTDFHDLLPLSMRIAKDMGYSQDEVIEAICKVDEKARKYPPVYNRIAWFCTVFKEKLPEARSNLLNLKLLSDSKQK